MMHLHEISTEELMDLARDAPAIEASEPLPQPMYYKIKDHSEFEISEDRRVIQLVSP